MNHFFLILQILYKRKPINLSFRPMLFLLILFNCTKSYTQQNHNRTIVDPQEGNPELSIKENPNSSLYVGKISMNEFIEVVSLIKTHHFLRDQVNDSIGFADAISNICERSNGVLYVYPKDYYYQFKEDRNLVVLGTEIRTPLNSKMVLLRSQSPKQNLAANNFAIEENLKWNLQKRESVYPYWKELNLKREDLEAFLLFVKDNLASFNIKKANKLITMDDVFENAINGFLSSLEPGSSFFDKASVKDKGKATAGIGVIIHTVNQNFILENISEDYPASKAGVKNNDILMRINNQGLENLNTSEVMNLIVGEIGSFIEIEVFRSSENDIRKFKIKREAIEIKNISSMILKGKSNLGYIKFIGFRKGETGNTSDQIKNLYLDLEKEASKQNLSLQGLILDIRDNSGGYLDEVINSIDHFIEKGILFTIKSHGQDPEQRNANIRDITKLPIAILINGRTASGAELFAGSLRDRNRAILLGEKTNGKSSINQLMQLKNNKDYLLSLFTSQFFLPSGNSTQVVGVEPDIAISSHPDGSFPFRFRESDRWRHLPIFPKQRMKDKFNTSEINKWIREKGIAEKEFSKNKKTDLFLLRSIDAFNGYLTLQPKSK